jgi:hypothetical protein
VILAVTRNDDINEVGAARVIVVMEVLVVRTSHKGAKVRGV